VLFPNRRQSGLSPATHTRIRLCKGDAIHNREVKWGKVDAPQWTIEGAMRALSLLHEAFRDNVYALSLHGSVVVNGRGNDLDLIAVPMELAVTPPEAMEQIMCELLRATPVPGEPKHGLLRTWSRACILDDGHQVDIEYRRPLPADWQSETRDRLIPFFWENGYHLEVCSFPSRVGDNYLDLLAVPVGTNVMLPERMDRLIREEFRAQLDGEAADGSAWHRMYLFDGWRLGIRYFPPNQTKGHV
jgi:hypothetical protein